MTLQFIPSQLEAARQSETLRRVAHEMAPADFQGELRVLQNFPGQPMRLVLVGTGRTPSSTEVPRTWLYDDVSEDDIRAIVSELFLGGFSEVASGRWCAA